MKKRHYISLAILLVGGLVSAAVLGRPRQLPLEECSPEYLRYKDAPGIKASFVKDFPVNDTLAVDALLLQATSDSAWCALLSDFGVPKELIDDYLSEKDHIVKEGLHECMVFYIDRNNPKQRMQYSEPDSRVVIGSHAKRSLCVFMTADTQFKELIFYNELDKTIHHEQNS